MSISDEPRINAVHAVSTQQLETRRFSNKQLVPPSKKVIYGADYVTKVEKSGKVILISMGEVTVQLEAGLLLAESLGRRCDG